MASAEPLSILHLDDVTEWRGGQQQVIYLHEGLLQKDVRSELLCQPDSKLADYCRDKNLPFTSQAMQGEFDFRAAYRIATYASQNGFQIIHSHSAHAMMLGIWAKYFNPKLKHVAHRRVDFSVRKPVIGVLKYNNRFVDRIVCISDAIKAVLQSDGVRREKLITIHSGVNVSKFEGISGGSGLRKSFSIPDNHLIVGTIAALVGHKDYPTLLKAARLVIDQFQNVTFLAAGEGVERKNLEQLHAQLGLGEKFRFLGFRSDVNALLSAFDIFVMSSKMEGMGTSILDAQAAGLPVVATRAGGISEVINDGVSGFLVPVVNAELFADKIMRLLRDAGLRKSMGKAAQGWVKQFDISETVTKTLQLYHLLLNNN